MCDSNANEIGFVNLMVNNKKVRTLEVFCFIPHSEYEQRYRGKNEPGVFGM